MRVKFWKFLFLPFGGMLILAAAVVLTLPLWWPWVLGRAMERFGVSYQTHERIGFTRFSLHLVEYRSETIRFQAERLEAFSPLGWWIALGRNGEEKDFFQVVSWSLEIEERLDTGVEKEVAEEISLYGVLGQVEKVVSLAMDWLPRAAMLDGTVAQGERQVRMETLEWRAGRLEASIHEPSLEQSLVFQTDLTGGLPFVFHAGLDPFPLRINLHLSPMEDGVSMRSELELAGNRLRAEADFARDGWLPRRGFFRSEDFELPPEYLKLPGYRNLTGSALLEWREGEYTLRLDGSAEPLEKDELFPPVDMALLARGDLQSAIVESLAIRSPWLRADLSAPVRMDYSGNLLSGESVFSLEADLSGQPFVELEGMLAGQVKIFPAVGTDPAWPRADFALTVRKVAGFGVAFSRVEAEGDFRWPLLRLDAVRVEGTGETLVQAQGEWDFAARALEGMRLEGVLDGGEVASFLPEGLRFDRVLLTADASGAWPDLQHGGRMEIAGFENPWTQPLAGELVWQGAGHLMEDAGFEVKSGLSHLLIDSTAKIDGSGIDMTVRSFEYRREGKVVLEALRPSRWAAGRREPDGWTFAVEGLDWRAGDGGIRLDAVADWPLRGSVEARVWEMDPDVWRDLLPVVFEMVDPRRLDFHGEWDGNALKFKGGLDARLLLTGQESVLLELEVEGGEEGLRVDRFRVSDERETLLFAEGAVPVSLHPSAGQVLRIHSEDPIRLTAKTEPGASFWEKISQLTGFHLEDPALRLEAGGTLQRPEGLLTGSVARLAWPEKEDAIPRPLIEGLRLEIGFDEERIDLRSAELRVEGQTVRAGGFLPMGTESWEKVVRERVPPDWRRANGRLRVEQASLAPLSGFFPTLVSPQGMLELDLRILPGPALEGYLQIEDLATRPMMPLGSIQEGTAMVVFEGKTAVVKEISGLIAGERLSIGGRIDLPLEQEAGFDLFIRGQKIPFVREPGMIIRGDLDLRVATRPDSVPLISGKVRLRDSFYLAQLRLMPGGAVATPSRRPPFFSIVERPFNQWHLDLSIRGDEFLNVRGGIFRGVASASFDLSGTLEEPRAVGDLTINRGNIRFPFTTMSIQQGVISLRRDNPFQPQLFVTASSTTFGYDLQLEMTGTAEVPVITFSSSPPLSSEEVLLMITAGELPRDQQLFTAQQRASRFAVFLGRNLLYQITGDDSQEDRLIITSGEHISEQGRATFGLEFQLARRWSVVGEYDRFDEYNAGLKYRLYTR